MLLTTRASVPYLDFAFEPDDTLLLGRESAGVPDEVRGCRRCADPDTHAAGLRSLNVALAAAMVLGEALRQTACR